MVLENLITIESIAHKIVACKFRRILICDLRSVKVYLYDGNNLIIFVTFATIQTI